MQFHDINENPCRIGQDWQLRTVKTVPVGLFRQADVAVFTHQDGETTLGETGVRAAHLLLHNTGQEIPAVSEAAMKMRASRLRIAPFALAGVTALTVAFTLSNVCQIGDEDSKAACRTRWSRLADNIRSIPVRLEGMARGVHLRSL